MSKEKTKKTSALAWFLTGLSVALACLFAVCYYQKTPQEVRFSINWTDNNIEVKKGDKYVQPKDAKIIYDTILSTDTVYHDRYINAMTYLGEMGEMYVDWTDNGIQHRRLYEAPIIPYVLKLSMMDSPYLQVWDTRPPQDKHRWLTPYIETGYGYVFPLRSPGGIGDTINEKPTHVLRVSGGVDLRLLRLRRINPVLSVECGYFQEPYAQGKLRIEF